MATKSTDWRPGPTVCRCCLSEGCYKDISTEYFWMGKREVYAEMLLNSFNLTISYSQSGGPNSNSRLICEPCISRLRDATDFKRQVQECEKTFTQYLDPGASSIGEQEVAAEQLDSEVKVELVKQEKLGSDDDDFDDRAGFDDDDDDDDLDDQPLTKLASKVPKKESVDILDLLDNAKAALKRKSTTKTKTAPVKKAKTTKKDAKPTSSSNSKAVKVEKKKKESSSQLLARRNAETVLKYSTAYPFRLRGKVLICVYCLETYEDPAKYRQHMDYSHKKFTVSTAFAHFTKYSSYLKIDVTGLKCRICFEPFDDLNLLAKHIYQYHDSRQLNLKYEMALQPYKLDKRNWECYICNKKLPSIITLHQHTVTHYKKYTCDTCGKSYYTSIALRCHIKIAHSGKFQCMICRQEFATEELRKEHCTLTKSCWAHTCTYCGDRFKSWYAKKKHMYEMHECPQYVYECAYCDFKSTNQDKFKTHNKKKHTEESLTAEKSFECPICFKLLATKKNLEMHMWIHNESKRFTCEICGKKFVQKGSLQHHIKSEHPVAGN